MSGRFDEEANPLPVNRGGKGLIAYKTNNKPPIRTWKQVQGTKVFNAVCGNNRNAMPRTIHIQNYSDRTVMVEFHKFTNKKKRPNDILTSAEKEFNWILQTKERPIITIPVQPGNSDCYVECAKHGVIFYQCTTETMSSQVQNHRGRREDSESQSDVFHLQENNSGKFLYVWDQDLLSYTFKRLNIKLKPGDIIIESGDNDQKVPSGIYLEFEVVSLTTKPGGGDSTAQIIPRSRIDTNVELNIPPTCLFIVRDKDGYDIETKNPDTRFPQNLRPQDNFLDKGIADCGDVIFVCRPEIPSPQKKITVNVVDAQECTPIFDGKSLDNSNELDRAPNTRTQEDDEDRN
jgi:hypothetical protein